MDELTNTIIDFLSSDEMQEAAIQKEYDDKDAYTLSSEKLPLSRLYDKIESQLRALSTLGVTTDKCAAMLLPLVESSLPEEILRVWQRSSETRNASDNAEVEGDQRICLAVEGFTLADNANKATSASKPRAKQETKDVATARNLIAVKSRDKSCVFCEKTNHESANCFKAKKMSLSEIKEVLKRKRACYNCLNVGHAGKFCRANVKCTKCSRHHVDLTCYDEEKRYTENRANAQSSVDAVNVKKECSLTTSSNVPTCFMQTLKVKLYTDTNELTMRAVIDSGSQNSYILKSVARQLNYEPIGKQNVVHLLFGDKKSSVTSHNKYLVRVGNLADSYWCYFEALDEDEICSEVPSVTKGSWLQELDRFNIKLTDVDSTENTVGLLIGEDVAGKLLTGQIRQLKNGMTAIETYLGWTLMGKVPVINERENLAVSAISMYVNSNIIEDLWSLDVLGIKDPIEHKTQKRHDEEVEIVFRQTIIKNEEGRYEVKLPWLESHPTLVDNKHLAIQRLQAMVNKLQKAADLPDKFSPMVMALERSGLTASTDVIKTKLLDMTSDVGCNGGKSAFWSGKPRIGNTVVKVITKHNIKSVNC
ncbi:uncharacterized protein LOC112906030 [Agrilus planipennis]|uniref:Uncharacterized protein LOC112906030 n=1 Tax=Agrilus planipennis TaxID=224129 RepID=A0A7F5RHL7_AGRPL|nr:uncharacterized protein LOC112906030 [Agrilus planipennis]